jgi:hypothetical protein
MSMEQDFLLVLKKSRDLKEIVGNRISLDTRPQDTAEPAIVVSRRSGGHEHHLRGSAGFAMPTMQVTCVAPQATYANRLRDKVRLSLQGFGGWVGQTDFMSIVLVDESHDHEWPLDAGDRGSFIRSLFFNVQYKARLFAHQTAHIGWYGFTEDEWLNFTEEQYRQFA